MRYFSPVFLKCTVLCLILTASLIPKLAIADTIVRSNGDDTIPISLGNHTVDGGGGSDTIQLPLFPNEYTFTPTGPTQYTVSYLDYTLEIDNVEYVEFGSSTQTKLSIYTMPSGEVQTKLAKLTDLYLAFFGRAPDVSGLEYWQKQLLAVGRDFATISKDFSWSTEAQALFPSEGSNRDFVQAVYQNCFGRNPDPDGWDYWTSKLNQLDPQNPEYLNDRGAFVGELLLGAYAPTSGEEDRNLLTNRHEVALSYVNRLSAQPEEGFDAAINDLLALTTGDAATQGNAKHVIDYVFDNPETLTEVMNNPALLNGLWGDGGTGVDPGNVDDDGDGFTENLGDCNDAAADINPGALDVCGDGIDQDCSGADEICPIDPNDVDNDGDGFTENLGDCNDSAAGINPGAAEICGDGIDQDCSGQDMACFEGFTSQILDSGPTYYASYPGDPDGTTDDGTTQETLAVTGAGPYIATISQDYFDASGTLVDSKSIIANVSLNQDGTLTETRPGIAGTTTLTLIGATADYLYVAGNDGTGTWENYWYSAKPAGWLFATNYQFSTAFIQYRAFENSTPPRQTFWLSLTKGDVAIQEADIVAIRLFTSTETTLTPTSSGFLTQHYMYLNCTVVPCSQSGPYTESGFWGNFNSLPADTYSLEVETSDGQTLNLDIPYPGQLDLPIVSSASMQSQWVGGDLVLNWTNPTVAANWSEVDQLRIVIFDNTNTDILYVRANPATETVTIPASVISQAAGLGDGSLARWEVQTRALDSNNINFARGFSNRVDLAVASPPTYAFNSYFLQYRNYENPNKNRYQGYIGLTKNDAPIQATDISTLRLLNSVGTLMTPSSEGFISASYMYLNCMLEPCVQSGPYTESSIWSLYSTMPADTYSLEVETTDGQTLNLDFPYSGQLVLPFVTSASMQSQWVGGDLVLNWTNPTGATNWSEVDQLRIVIFDSTNSEILYVRINPDMETVTIPASMISQAVGLGDGTLAQWEVQTRTFDTNNMNVARGYSNRVAIMTP